MKQPPRIAFIGWGSLIWNPRDLPLASAWSIDGPTLCLEFSRKSLDGRLTLVIDEEGTECRLYWALAACADLESARQALMQREGAITTDVIHHVERGAGVNGDAGAVAAVNAWLASQRLDAAVWTGLKPKFAGFSVDAACDYLASREGSVRSAAREYVERAPLQVRTQVRSAVEQRLGWLPRSPM